MLCNCLTLPPLNTFTGWMAKERVRLLPFSSEAMLSSFQWQKDSWASCRGFLMASVATFIRWRRIDPGLVSGKKKNKWHGIQTIVVVWLTGMGAALYVLFEKLSML